MRQRALFGAGVASLALVVTACGSAPAAGDGSSSWASSTRSANAFVVGGEELWQRRTDLLSVLGRMSAVQVRRSDPCPTILMRGQKTYVGSSDPYIYVNGTQASNTCLLEMMRTEDVDRIEVYPSGVSNRPEYASNPNGLILIFLRNAHSDLPPDEGAGADRK
jgi:hypothetical protein